MFATSKLTKVLGFRQNYLWGSHLSIFEICIRIQTQVWEHQMFLA